MVKKSSRQGQKSGQIWGGQAQSEQKDETSVHMKGTLPHLPLPASGVLITSAISQAAVTVQPGQLFF